MKRTLRVMVLMIIVAFVVVAPVRADETSLHLNAPISDVVISVHPTVATVLVVSWNQDVAADGGWLEFSFNGSTRHSPQHELAQGPQEELVLGVPSDTPVEVRIKNRFRSHIVSSAETWTATTGSLPENLEEPRLETFDRERALHARFLLVSLNNQAGGWGLILNREGRIVWYRSPIGGHEMLVPRVARSGNHLLFDTDTYWTFPNTNEVSTIRRVTIADEVLETIEVPRLHHAWDERTDGTIVWGYSVTGLGGEQLWAIDPEGNSWKVWDSADWQVPGSVASNTTNWVEQTDTVLMMFWTNASAVEIDFESGEIIRQFGGVPGSWAFEPEDSKFGFSHGIRYTQDHTLIVSTHLLQGPGQQQRIREYSLDDASETLTQVWEYGEGADIYAPTWGEASRLPNGNTILNTGSEPLIREVTTDGETVWELEWGGSKTLGHMTFIEGLSDLYSYNGE